MILEGIANYLGPKVFTPADKLKNGGAWPTAVQMRKMGKTGTATFIFAFFFLICRQVIFASRVNYGNGCNGRKQENFEAELEALRKRETRSKRGLYSLVGCQSHCNADSGPMMDSYVFSRDAIWYEPDPRALKPFPVCSYNGRMLNLLWCQYPCFNLTVGPFQEIKPTTGTSIVYSVIH